MKTMISVAGYGLAPIPILCETHTWIDNDEPPLTAEDANAALLAWYRHIAAERMATNDEIARVCQELEELDAKQQGDSR
jgi:hypothetical protein